MEWRRRVVPAEVVTTHAKPYAQQQLARDLEVERAAMGSAVVLEVSARCSEAIRSHADGWISCKLQLAIRSHADCWISCKLQLCCCRAKKKADSEPATSLSGNLKKGWEKIRLCCRAAGRQCQMGTR